MSNQSDRERLAALETEIHNMKSDIFELKQVVKTLGWYVGFGVGMTVTINTFAVLWVAFYHH